MSLELLPHTEATFCWLEDVNGANCFLHGQKSRWNRWSDEKDK